MNGISRGTAGGTPKVPWRMGGATGPPDDVEALTRGVAVLFALTNPVAAAASFGAGLVVARPAVVRRVRWWWVALGALAAWPLAVLVHGGRAYLRPYRELAAVVGDNLSGSVGAAVLALASERWPGWVVSQLVIAGCAAMTFGAWRLYRLGRYAQTWAEQEEAAEVLAPRELAKLAGREERWLGSQKPARTFNELTLSLGIDPEKSKPCRITGRALGLNCVVTGPSGFGKTTTMLRLAEQVTMTSQARALDVGWLMVDMKADPELVSTIAAMAAASDRGFHLVQLGERTMTYNPLRHGSAEACASKIIEMVDAAEGFTEPHHKSVGETWLIVCLTALDDLIAQGVVKDATRSARAWRRDLGDLAELMQHQRLAAELPRLGARARRLAQAEFDAMKAVPNRGNSIDGLTNRVKLMTLKSSGRILTEHSDGLDLYDALMAGDFILFSLDAMGDAAAARVIGNLALEDMAMVLARMQDAQFAATGRRALLMLDEFSVLGGDGLQKFFERARAAGGSVVLGSQTDGNFKAVSDEFHEAVLTNCNVWVMHQQRGQVAEERAKAFGTRQAMAETRQVTTDAGPLGTMHAASGVGSLREVDKFVLHPNVLRNLQPYETVVATFGPQSLQRVQISPAKRWPVPENYLPDPLPAEDDQDEPRQPTSTEPLDDVLPIRSHGEPAPPATSSPTSTSRGELDDELEHDVDEPEDHDADQDEDLAPAGPGAGWTHDHDPTNERAWLRQ